MGIDVGGTFTDFVMLDRLSGRLAYHKEPSNPADPAAAIGAGIAALFAATRAAPADLELVVHGTTIALNAILQRRGASVALVVSPGNGDILEIARVRMSDSYSFYAQPEAALVDRDAVIEINARIGVYGEIILRPEVAEIAAVAARIDALGVDSVAVSLLNAPANPEFEAWLAGALGALTTITVTASTSVWSEVREFERTMVSVMNAYVTPVMRDYYHRLGANLAGAEIVAPLLITTSNGGSVDVAIAGQRPIDSLLSGPASGVAAAIDASRRAGIERIVTFDMGGTSADIAVAIGTAAEITTRSSLGELPLILPVVNVSAIGAGGGSIVRVDQGGLLKVGPASAGAVPGPACFGKGGVAATITDCYLVCGLLDAANFAGGRLPLSHDLALASLQSVGEALGFSGADVAVRAASAALRVASSMMATEMRKTLARRGSDPADFVLLPYGGAGPTHAALLAEEAGIDKILVAQRPGIFCALGAVVADLRRDFVRSAQLFFGGSDDAVDEAALAAMLASLCELATEWSDSVEDRTDHWRLMVTADLRYPAQAFDLTAKIDDYVPGTDAAARLVAGFHADHLRLYGFYEPDNRVELRRLVLSVIGVLPQVAAPPDQTAVERSLQRRPIFLGNSWRDATIVKREQVGGAALHGPAIVEQSDTTIVVPPGWAVRRLEGGCLMMIRDEGAA